MRHTDRN